MQKKIVVHMYLKNGKAVTGFDGKELLEDGDVMSIAQHYSNNGADELLIFDLSDDDADHEQSLNLIRQISRVIDIPMSGGGHIKNLEDVKKLLYAGCQQVFLNYAKAANIDLTEEVSKRFGKEKMAVCISSTEEFTANQALIESFADEVLALDTIQDEIHACSSIKIILHTEVSKTAALKSLLQKDSVYALSGAYISSLDISLQDFKADCKADGIPVVTFESAIAWADFKLNSDGLIPVVVQDCKTDQVLMVAYMNADTIKQTLETGRATFWSRSRQEVWVKGDTSGNYMYVKEVRVDCDCDCLVVLVNPAGPACHTGNRSCFFRKIEDGKLVEDAKEQTKTDVFAREQAVVMDRKEHPEEGSYTNYLFDKGEDKILKKVGEEAAEVVIAGKNRDKDEISYETADLIYHLTVMLVDNGMTWEDIYKEMERRSN